MNFEVLTNFLDTLPKRGIPGVDCAIYYKNKSVYRHSAGYADVKSRRPITSDDLYYLYSATKVITCTAALQLFEKGRFLMTDPLYEYLPEFRDMDVRHKLSDGHIEKRPALNSIKVQDLFTMSAGLTYNINSEWINAVKIKTEGRCPTRQTVEAISKEPLMFEPGTHWNYSLCHDVLGALIEVISGQSFSNYLREHIFEPVGMKDTGFSVSDDKLGRIATKYCFNDKLKIAEETPADNIYKIGTEYESGGAGLISSVDDYILFANALCNNGRTIMGEKILSKCTIDLMRTNHLSDVALWDFNWVQMSGYGYGLGVRTMINKALGGSVSSIGEFGWGGAAGAYVLIDPECELTVFYAQHLLNSMEPFVHPRIRNIVYLCLDA